MKLGIGNVGRVGVFAIAIASAIAGCGDNGITPQIDAGEVDARPDAALPPAQLSISPLTSDFGTVTVGQTSGSMSFTVTNTGGSPSGSLSAQIMGAGAANFSVETNTCTVLAANATCTVAVSFSPASAGMKTGNLIVSGTPGGSVSVALDGRGAAIGNISITPSTNAYGNVVVGATSATTGSFTVTNTGGTTTGALSVSLVGSDPGDFIKQTDTCTAPLAAAATCTITVSFKPLTAGAKAASLQVATNPGGTTAAALSGTGLAPAQLSVNPGLLDFGSIVVNASSNNQTFTVVNIGGVVSGPVSGVLAGTDASQFAIIANCTTALNPNQSCTIVVQFKPTTTGGKAAQLNVTGTPGGTVSSTLLGTGIGVGQITITPTTGTYGNTTVGQVSASQMFTVTNTGGSSTGALATALGGTDPGEFTIVTGSNGCAGVVLAANGTCTLAITFNPATGGAKAANITVSGTPGGVATAGLNGNAIPDALLAISPASHDYGTIGTGTQTPFTTFTITNNGGQTTGAIAVSVNGPQAAQFVFVSACAAALAPLATCTVQVRYAPNANGNASATLNVSSTPGGAVAAGLFGQANDPASLAVSPGSLAFNNGNGPAGQVLLGELAQKTFDVTNLGNVPTGTLSFVISGVNAADYTQTNNCSTLPAGMSCTVTITFTPGARGTRNASIAVSAAPGGSASVSLTGDALPRLEILTPSTNPFIFTPDSVINTTAPLANTLTIRNNTRTSATLTRTLTNVAATPGGGAALDFQVNGTTCGATLASDSTCTASVEFEPDTVGLKNGNVLFSIGGTAFDSASQDYRGTGVDSLLLTANTVTTFGNVAQNTASPSLVFTVTNPNNSPTSGAIGTTLSNGAFQILGDTCAGNTLLANGTCTITVKYLPTVGGGVTQTATLAVAATPGGSPSLSLSGVAVDPANLQFTPNATLDFANVFSGEAKTLSVVVSNPAGAAISGPVQFSKTGADSTLYTLQPGAVQGGDCSNNVTTLGPGASCNIRIQFSPTGIVFGAKNAATLSVSANPGTTATKNIALHGNSVSTISMAPATFDYGNVNTGSTLSHGFVVTNNGSLPVTFTSTTLTPASAEVTITTNTCNGTLAASGTCTVTVRYAPSASGSFAQTLAVNTANGIATSTLTGHANTAANVNFTESFTVSNPFDFGSTLAGENGITRTFTVRNDGEATAAAITGLLFSDAVDFTIVAGNTCVGTALTGGATCTVTARFNPMPSVGTTVTQTSTLSIVGPAMGTINPTVSVTGRRLTAGSLVFTPTIASFPDTVVGLTSATQVVTVQNTSSSAYSFNIGSTLSNTSFAISADFPLVSTTCGGTLISGAYFGASLAPGGSCTVTISFSPQAAGDRSAALMTADNAAPDVNTTPYAALTGRGLAPANITVSTTNPTFSNTAIGAQSTSIVTLTNTGGVTSGTIVQGPFTAPDASSFSKGGCGGTLAAGASCDITITFGPGNAGAKSSSFMVVATPGLVTTVISLNATAVTNATIGITPTTQANAGSRAVGELDPAGTVFTITNGGAVPSGNLAVQLSNNTDYVIDDAFVGVPATCVLGAPLAAGATCQVRVKFNPATLGNGLTTLVTAFGTPGGSVAGSITGNGTSAVTANVATQSFGNVTAGMASAPFTFTFTNNADVPTGLLHTALAGANATQFSLAGAMADDCAGKVLTAAGGATPSCTITVRFTPGAGAGTGARTATLTVSGTPGNAAAVTMNGTAQ